MSKHVDRKAQSYPFRGEIDTDSLELEWAEAPWDTAVYGEPVLQITRIKVHGKDSTQDITAFELARDAAGSGLTSCRLPHEQLRESMLLESRGFRFVEMLYMPELDQLGTRPLFDDGLLEISRATESDLLGVVEIAGTAFRNERFYVDSRLSPSLSDLRYKNWARDSFLHPTQCLFVVRDGSLLIGFFVTEDLPDGTCYWHLNAVATEHQGKGYGRRAWSAMINYAQAKGAERVRTSVAARNHRVINLYARLGFRFPPPLMTFHWVRAD